MWHLAAIYDLAVKAEIAWKVNVEGTRMVCELRPEHILQLNAFYILVQHM